MRTKMWVGVVAGVAALQSGSELRAERIFLTNGTTITTTDSTSLAVATTVPVVGLQAGESLVGIDVRPASPGTLYGVGSTSRIYTINPTTGLATAVSATPFSALSGTAFGTDFNPVPDRIRQVSDTEQNLRLNPNDGTGVTDGNLNPAGNFVGVAYTNNFPGATSTQLYAIDSAAGTLSLIGNPNNGTPITPVGSLGLGTNLSPSIGFDISGATGSTAFASITVGGQSRLYTVNLATGAATNLGTIGTGTTPFLGLAAASAPEPGTVALLGIASAGLLLRRRSAARA